MMNRFTPNMFRLRRYALLAALTFSSAAHAEWPFPERFATADNTTHKAANTPTVREPVQLLVRLNRHATAPQMQQLIQQLRQTQQTLGVNVIGGNQRLGMIQLEVPASQVDASKAALMALTAVTTIGENLRLSLTSVDGVTFEANEEWWYQAIRAEAAWFVSRGNSATTVAVVDSGMASTQQSLESNRLTTVSHDGTPMTADDSATDHGTAIMVFAAGYKDDPLTYDMPAAGNNVRGVNHNAQALSVDVVHGSSLTLANVLQGVATAATMGADLINLSIGYDGSGCSDDACRYQTLRLFRELFDPAVTVCRDEGALLVFSAGNLGLKEDDTRFNTSSSFDSDDANRRWDSNVVVVGATEPSASTDFVVESRPNSTQGAVIDIMAPGNVLCPAQDANPDLSCFYFGTSFATPIALGAASLAAGIDTTFRPVENRTLLLDAAANIVVTDHSPDNHPDAAATVASAELLAKASYDGQAPIVFNGAGQTATVTITTTVPASGLFAGDILFLQDVSQSQHDDIDALQSKFSALITDLDSRGIDFNYGIAAFSDFPNAPWGDSNDTAFNLLTGITSDRSHVNAKVNELDMPLLSGGDARESQYEALRQTMLGRGLDENGNGDYDDANDIKPAAIGWRTTAKRIVVLSTDAPFHNHTTEASYPGASRAEATTLLNNHNASVIGLDSHNTKGDLEALTTATNGAYFRTDATPQAIGDAIEAAIEAMQNHVDVSAEVLSGEQFVSSMSPSVYSNRTPGAPISFTVQLQNPYPDLSSSAPDQQHDLVFWVRGNGAVFHRVYVPIRITPP